MLLHAPRILGFDVVLHLLQLGQHLWCRLLLNQVMEFLDECTRAGEAIGNVVKYGLLGGVWQFLVKIGDLDFRLGPELTSVGLDLATQQFHERGFAGAIAAQQAPAFAGLDRQRNFVEQHLGAIG